jgi:PhnB protein
MKTLTPYLTFAGNCEEALEFYQQALAGDIVSLERFGESSTSVEEAQKQLVRHAVFEFEDDTIFAADDPTFLADSNKKSPIKMCLGLGDNYFATKYFTNLSQSGTIQTPLHDTDSGGMFGELTDKFGVHWVIISVKSKPHA